MAGAMALSRVPRAWSRGRRDSAENRRLAIPAGPSDAPRCLPVAATAISQNGGTKLRTSG
jgi:hypothetical protein